MERLEDKYKKPIKDLSELVNYDHGTVGSKIEILKAVAMIRVADSLTVIADVLKENRGIRVIRGGKQ